VRCHEDSGSRRTQRNTDEYVSSEVRRDGDLCAVESADALQLAIVDGAVGRVREVVGEDAVPSPAERPRTADEEAVGSLEVHRGEGEGSRAAATLVEPRRTSSNLGESRRISASLNLAI